MTQTRNYWPLGVIFTFIVFISGTVCLVVFACNQRVDLVSADYYEQELKFQQHLDQINRANLGQLASVRYDRTTCRINISVRPEAGTDHVTGHIQLYRPSAAGLDRNFPLDLDNQGLQSLDAVGLRPGLWKVRISWTVQDQQYFLDKAIIVGPSAPPLRNAARSPSFQPTHSSLGLRISFGVQPSRFGCQLPMRSQTFIYTPWLPAGTA